MSDAPTLVEWIVKAEGDFKSAYILLSSGEENISDAAGFHCQQCAEKYLKAYLQDHSVEFPRTHSLIALKELCVTLDNEFEQIHDALSSLEVYAIAARYPGLTVNQQQAAAAFNIASQIRSFIRKKLEVQD